MEIERTLTLPSSISEGWGITYDKVKKEAYITDGSKNVYVCEFASDFSTLTVKSTINTQYIKINELEFVETDKILANRYLTNFITELDLTQAGSSTLPTWEMTELRNYVVTQL